MSGLSITVASFAGLLWKATLVLSLALALAWLARRGSARTLHLLWTTTFAAVLALPVLGLLGPSWTVPILPARDAVTELSSLEAFADAAPTGGAHGESAEAAAGLGSPAPDPLVPDLGEPNPRKAGSVPPAPARPVRTSAPGHPTGLVFLIWALGCGGALTSLAVGVFRFRKLVRTAVPVRDPAWLRQRDAINRRLGLRAKVRVLLSADAATPMTGGLWRPAILLPSSAETWPADRGAVVLAHELVHVRRLDPLRQLLSRAVTALYWFHPLSWLASRLATAAREQSCDEEVLELGTRPSEYARHLLSLASPMTSRPAPLALPMAQHSELENRMMSILRPSRPRYSTVRTSLALGAIGVAGILAACSTPVPRDPPASPEPQDEIAQSDEPAPPVLPTAAPAMTSPAPTGPLTSHAAPVASRAPEPAPAPSPMPEANAFQQSECDRGSWAGMYRDDEGLAFQTSVDGMWLCMRSQGSVRMTPDGTAIRDMDDGSWLVLQSQAERVHRLVIAPGPGGLDHDWSIDGRTQPFDAEAREWRDRMFIVLARSREAQEIRGEEAGLRGQIASHSGRMASLRGEIASHQGHVASLRGRIASYQGHVAGLHGQMASRLGRASRQRATQSAAVGMYEAHEAAWRAMEAVDVTGALEAATQAMEAADVTEALKVARQAMEAVDVTEALEAAAQAMEAADVTEALKATTQAMEAVDVTEALEVATQAMEAVDVTEALEAATQAMEAVDSLLVFETVSEVMRQVEERMQVLREDTRQLQGATAEMERDLEVRLGELEQTIDEYDLDARVAEIEAEIEAYDLDGKVGEIETEIEQYDLDGKIRDIEAQIEELDADQRIDEIERSLQDEIAAIRRLVG